MQPANYTAKLGNAQVKGDFFYRGAIDGSVQLPSPPSETGTWKPVAEVAWNDLRLTACCARAPTAAIATP